MRWPKQFHTERALQRVLSVPLAWLYVMSAGQCTRFMFPSEVCIVVPFPAAQSSLDKPSLCYMLVIPQLVSARLGHIRSLVLSDSNFAVVRMTPPSAHRSSELKINGSIYTPRFHTSVCLFLSYFLFFPPLPFSLLFKPTKKS